MNSLKKLALVALVALIAPVAANAQISSVLSKLTGSSSSSSSSSSSTISSIVSVVSNLLGSNTVSEKNLVGTWNYSEPCVVLESDNVLSNIGGTVVTEKIESEEKKILEKVGFTAGKVVMVLNSDKSGTITVGSKTTNITWDIDDSNLQLTYLTHTTTVNTSLSGSTLQLAMDADKLLSLVSSVASSASSLSSSMSTVTSLLSKYDGLYLGLKFTK